jgi:hypothetical protein
MQILRLQISKRCLIGKGLPCEISNLQSAIPRWLPRWYAWQAPFTIGMRKNTCKNGLFRVLKLENPRKIRCFPQARGYKIGPAGIKPIF